MCIKRRIIILQRESGSKLGNQPGFWIRRAYWNFWTSIRPIYVVKYYLRIFKICCCKASYHTKVGLWNNKKNVQKTKKYKLLVKYLLMLITRRRYKFKITKIRLTYYFYNNFFFYFQFIVVTFFTLFTINRIEMSGNEKKINIFSTLIRIVL